MMGVNVAGKSYVHVVKGNSQSRTMESDSAPAIVLDDNCLHSKDLSNSVLGRVKEFAALSNLKTALTNEEVPGWVPDFLEESDDDESDDESKGGDPKAQDLGSCGDDSDVVEVPEMVFEGERQSNDKLDEESTGQMVNQSEDPFGIYTLLNKKKVMNGVKGTSDQSLKYPPGFTPNENMNEFCTNVENVSNVNCDNSQDFNVEETNVGQEGNSVRQGCKEDVSESACSGLLRNCSLKRSGEGVSMNYLSLNIQGLAQKAKKDWVKELCVKYKVNFLALQETKMESIDFFNVKMCWGNFGFDYVHSDSVGNSGGILCVWDPNSFRRINTTISDYFVMVRGVWLKTGNNLLIVSVYAPHDMKDKHMLWDYLRHVIQKWNEEVVLMGDFDEVRYKSDRFGSVFNAHGANVFNSFIANGAIILERYLSDHRPILLRESQFDYGPIPFRFYHHWFKVEGFNKFVEDTWSEAPGVDSNAMCSMSIKLKHLKLKIREWNKGNMKDMKSGKAKYKEDLEALDAAINNGDGSVETVTKRMEVVKSLQDIDKLQAMEMAQKAKIKWSIEGDENSSFFHGMLNKRQSQLSIRGIMVDGVWIEDPYTVKREFYQHFSKRFDKPVEKRAHIDMNYPNTITLEHINLNLKPTYKPNGANDLGLWDGQISWYESSGTMYSDTSMGEEFLKAVHGELGNSCKDTNGGYSILAGLIIEMKKLLKNQGINLFDFMRLKLGNGNKIAFWDDNWIGGNILNDLYPRMYALENCKKVTVSLKLANTNLDVLWIWSLKGSGEFSVASIRKAIINKRISDVNSKTRWIKSVPNKSKIFSDDLEKHESYFLNLVTKLLSSYEEGLKPSVDRIEKYVSNLSNPSSNVDKKDSKMINPQRNLKQEYLDYEAKVPVVSFLGQSKSDVHAAFLAGLVKPNKRMTWMKFRISFLLLIYSDEEDLEGDEEVGFEAKKLQVHHKLCNGARRLKDWNKLVNATMLAIFAGADFVGL
ncbi:RNA-directed DNA polymerase, eukaryota [Tanacetum coccineum]